MSNEYLIAEFTEIFAEFRRVRNEGIKRLNFFITLISAIFAGLIFVFQLTTISLLHKKLIFISSFIFMMIIGFEFYRYLISRDISSDFNMRAMSKIRSYFISKDPNIHQYILWHKTDEPSFYLKRERLPSIISTMSLIISLMISCTFSMILSFKINDWYILLSLALIILIIFLFLSHKYAKNKFDNALLKINSELSSDA